MTAKRVLSVGQCMADHGGISHTLRQAFGAEVESADSVEEAVALMQVEAFALVLVNRLFDADGTSGLDLIQTMQADPALKALPVMLVSNYEDAQKQAVASGAVQGFGKATLGRPAMLERVKPYFV